MNYLLKKIQNYTLSSNKLILIVSLYIVGIFNFPFLSKVINATLSLTQYNLLFLLSVPFFLLSLVIIINSLFFWKYSAKIAAITFIIISTLIFYAMVTYGIVFDYSMVQNTAETDMAESLSYVNTYAIGFVLLFAGLPIIIISQLKITYRPFVAEVIQRGKLILSSLAFVFVIAYFFYSNYAAVGRNNHELVNYIVPYKFLNAGYKYVKRNYTSPATGFKLLDSTPQLVTNSISQKQVTVMVVGETARADNFSANGYEKNTNRYTKELGVESFSHMASCGTATAISVPCMFSLLEQESFSKRAASSQQNIIDIIQLAGTDVLWVDNNSSCKGVCQRVPTILIPTDKADALCDGDYCFDEILLRALKDKLANLTKPSTLIVLHMMGSHGPTYYRRYPKSKRVFMPDCQRSDIQNCSQEELVNTYDNTIAYTDYVLAKIIGELQKAADENNINSKMLYVSDHGESLGESGAYLHGLPYAFAPDQQTHIPMLYWDNLNSNNKINSCEQKLLNNQYSHDNISHTLLGIMQVESKVYQVNKDIFATCQVNSTLAQHAKAQTLAAQISLSNQNSPLTE